MLDAAIADVLLHVFLECENSRGEVEGGVAERSQLAELRHAHVSQWPAL
jgi:hypothetical protein